MNGSVSLRDELLTKEELREKFGVLNYVVFFAMLVVSVLIGVFYWYRGNKTTEDFLLASRSMSTGQYSVHLYYNSSSDKLLDTIGFYRNQN